MDSSSTTLQNWQRAASELGFEFIAPFELTFSEEQFEYFGFVPKFGGKSGLVIVLGYDSRLVKTAQINGYAYSCLCESRDKYVAQDFIDVLNDWGWCRGGEDPPKWYSGQPWSQ